MPGHPIGEALKKETIHNIEVLTEAITKHDVVFLLLDTREARWLPTLIAASYGKVRKHCHYELRFSIRVNFICILCLYMLYYYNFI